MTTPLSVFISYAREDEPSREKLSKHLSSLQKEDLIAGWYDRLTTAGRDWETEIKIELERADIVLLLVSSDFTGSDYCVGVEAALAVERWRANKTRVVPIILRSVDWRKLPLGNGDSQTNLGLLNALPRDGKPVKLWADEDEAYENITTGLRAVIDEINRQRLAAVQAAPIEPPPVLPSTRLTTPSSSASLRTGRDPAQAALDKLLPFIENDSVTWFVGPRAASRSLDAGLRPCDIARKLLADLQIVDHQWTQLLPPVDIAASYYAVKRGVPTLLQDVSDWIATDVAQIPVLYQRIASVLALTKLRLREIDKKALRPLRRNSQLVVTTNIDLMMERAMLAAGLPFTRLVQIHSEPRLEATDLRGIERLDNGHVGLRSADTSAIVAQADPADPAQLDRLLAAAPSRSITLEPVASNQTNNQNALESLSLKEFRDPILYKLRGSLDIPESCAISSEQYLEFCLNMANYFVPTQVGTIVQHTPAVFLGFGYLDPDFRLVYYTFLKALTELRKEDRKLYSVQLPPAQEPDDNYRNMELSIWDDLKDSGPRKAKIITVEESNEQFMTLLLARVDPTGALCEQALTPGALTGYPVNQR